jgi:hypothetical protein
MRKFRDEGRRVGGRSVVDGERMMDSLGVAIQSWPGGGADRTGGVLVVADDETGEDAVALSGLRPLGRVAWRAAEARLQVQGAVSVILAEADGVPDEILAQTLPLLDQVAARQDARIVVTFAPSQIDLVAASLRLPGAELLCDPSPAERLAALCVAGLEPATAVHDIGREAEAQRLRRLNDEVARIAETLARLSRGEESWRRDAPDAGVGEPGMAYRGPPVADGIDITARDIRDAIRARRLRDQYFGAGLFEDPAWDMLLDLFAAELERAQVSVSSLCIAAAVAPTTALRWISRMTDTGLFVRNPDPFDRRRAFMALSDRASGGMRGYVSAVKRAGLGIA